MRVAGLCLGLSLTSMLAVGGAIEDWVETSADPDAIQEWLDELRARPLDLSSATADQIAALPFLDLKAAQRIIAARSEAAGYASVDQVADAAVLTEMQRESLERFAVLSVPGADHAVVRIVRQSLGGTPTSRLRADFHASTNTRGFLSVADAGGGSELSAGAEFRSPNSSIRLIAGDFQVEGGTGLVFASAYGMASWLSSSAIGHPPDTRGLMLKPTSDGLARFRGTAFEIRRPHFCGIVVGSAQGMDAKRADDRITRITEGDGATGELRRTRADAVEERLAGLMLEASTFSSRLGCVVAHSRLSLPIEPMLTPEDPEQFSGDHLTAGSVYAAAKAGRMQVIGEAAKSNPGGFAYQSALTVNGGRLSVAVYDIFAAKDYYALHSKVWGGFGEEANNRQQTGCKLRIRWLRETVNLHAWNSQSPFRTSRFPLRRGGSGAELRSETGIARTLAIVLSGSREWREEIDSDQPSQWQYDRVRVETIVRALCELRFRLEFKSAGAEGLSNHSTGSLLFVQARGETRGVSLFFRVSAFNAGDNTVAMRAYEESPVGVSSLTALSGRGRRVAAMARRDFGVMAGAVKIAQTITENPERDVSVEAALQLIFQW